MPRYLLTVLIEVDDPAEVVRHAQAYTDTNDAFDQGQDHTLSDALYLLLTEAPGSPCDYGIDILRHDVVADGRQG